MTRGRVVQLLCAPKAAVRDDRQWRRTIAPLSRARVELNPQPRLMLVSLSFAAVPALIDALRWAVLSFSLSVTVVADKTVIIAHGNTWRALTWQKRRDGGVSLDPARTSESDWSDCAPTERPPPSSVRAVSPRTCCLFARSWIVRSTRGGSRGLRGGSHSQFKSRLGGWVTFAALGVPKGGHFRSFRSFRARCLSRAFARLSRAIRTFWVISSLHLRFRS